MTTQHELAQQALAARDQLVKAQHEIERSREHRVTFEVSWSLTPVFVLTSGAPSR